MIGGKTALYGLIGHPVSHTLSPAMHNAAYAARSIDAVYVPLPVPPARLREAVHGAYALGFSGLNVTVPHKQAVAELCVRLDGAASLCRAVNTLRRTPEGWEGFNTDAPAMLELLREAGARAGTRAVILGAGGAALASAWALSQLGIAVDVVARRMEAAEVVCERTRAAAPDGAPFTARPWSELVGRCEGADLVLNATSIGLHSNPATFPPFRLRPEQLVVDVVYGATAFMTQARAAAARVVTGEQLLVRQGALAFTLWTGHPAPEPVMTDALRTPPPPHPHPHAPPHGT